MKTEKIRKIQEKYGKIELVPSRILFVLWLVSLACPNLIYSGVMFADTLHILKWTVTGVPIAIAVIVAGYRLLRYPESRVDARIDAFGVIWLLILVYCAVQPLWVEISSPTSYALEMTCFAAVWAFYVLSVQSWPDWGLSYALIFANINAALNVGFAELQNRSLNDFSFLEGTVFEPLRQFSTIILPTPENYIGNTAQQNMFGLWVAIAVLGAVYLFVFEEKRWVIILASINFWGLMNSTSRSASIALLGGLVLLLMYSAVKFGKSHVKRFFIAMAVLSVVFYASLYSPRSEQIVVKTADVIRNAENIGNRRGIWLTSYAMLLEHPEGVGVGQYKWHYLEGQRAGYRITNADWYKWQYTHWAHNEFLQFFCEGGLIGGLMLIVMWLTWFVPVAYMLFRRVEVSKEAVWAVCLASLVTFVAIFTRPFHRIENMVWITLAFAISNREFLAGRFKFKVPFRKLNGALLMLSAIMGIVYISSGIYGNYVLRQALSTHNASLQLRYLNEAELHPIVREEAIRNKGYHFIQTGEQTGNRAELQQGFTLLWEHFKREPKSEDIGKLLDFAQRYQIEPVLREIASYFKPGMYHLKRIPQRDSSGRVVNALLLVNGPGSDDE